jgi:hypothetical protein
MDSWSDVISIAVGGLVAMGFLDEQRLIIGSHSGAGVFDATSGRAARVPIR